MIIIISRYTLLVILLFTLNLYPQSKHNVITDGATLIVQVNDIVPEFKEEKSTGITRRDYYKFTDPSNPGTYKLPSINVFLAIPANSIVKISDTEFDSRIDEKVIPVLNPEAVLNDSVIVYRDKNYSEISNSNQVPLIQIEKYFWFREFYIVQLKVNNFRFHPDKSNIEVFSNIKFKVNVSPAVNFFSGSRLQIKTDYDNALYNLISNSEIAEQFRNENTILLDDTTGNWIDYNATYVKIGVIEDAVHRITHFDLTALGINTSSIDPRTFKIYESGRELDILVLGENDGVFDQNDFIEFWGHKNYPGKSYHIINEDDEEYNEYLNRYTDTTFYFLTWNPNNGNRADTINIDPTGINDTLFYYSKLLHFEINPFFDFNDNNEIANQTPSWNKNKTWYRHTLIAARTYNVTLDEIFPDRNAGIHAKAVSWASSIETNSHQVKLLINNVLIDSNSIDRFKQLLLSGERNSSNLISGTNQIKLENIPNGSDPNGLLVDWFEIEYPRNLKLTNDSLFFKVSDDIIPGLKILKILNANAAEYRIYKVHPEFKIVTNYQVSSSTIVFADTVFPGDEYYILSTIKSVSPKFFQVKNFVNIRSITDQTDYIAVTHPGFLLSVQNYIQSIANYYSLTTSAFNVYDIFDEFSFGYPYPEGIRLFLNVFYNNVQLPKPQYLNLIGDSNYDYKYFTGTTGGKNYVTSFGNPVGDNWFAIWDLTGVPIPQLKVGRIPINNSSQLSFYLSKIDNNESGAYDAWNKRYLFFSGGIQTSEYDILKSVNDSLINRLIIPRPVGGDFTHFYKTASPPSDFGPYTPDQIQDAIYNGGLFISYIGHSGTATWDNSINETNQLFNGVNRNPLITDFGCSTNKYAEPQIVCFGERFLFNQTGQAISYVGNSSLGFQSTAINVPILFYESVVSDSISEIGNANLQSKIKLFALYGNNSVNRVFSLSNIILGDPAARIKIPKLSNFRISSSDIVLQLPVITDNLDSAEFNIAFNNFGTADTGLVALNIVQIFGSTIIKNVTLNLPIPAYSDTISFWAIVKDLPGNHTLDINIDQDNLVEEIYENDNSLTFQFNVASSSLRDFLTSRFENSSIQSLKLLNPSTAIFNPFTVETQISQDIDFTNPNSIITNPDTIITEVSFPSLPAGSRNYLRYRINAPGGSYGIIKSFYNEFDSKFLLNDSLAFSLQELNNLRWENNSVQIVPDTVNVSVLSAGWPTSTCVIAKDGINLLSNTFFAGMGIVVFDNVTLEVDTSAWFQLFNQPDSVEALANLIDSIPTGKIVAMGVADDAANNMSQHLRDAIKTLGSAKIDSLVFRGSWAIIGWKGAPTGTVPEEVRPALPLQSVFIDTSYIVQSESGNLTLNEIGPAGRWTRIETVENIPGDASSQYYLYGIQLNGQTDSLGLLTFQNGISDISFLDPKLYPKITVVGEYKVSSANISPSIMRIAVDFNGTAELATNYQVVSISKDTVTTGEDVTLNFSVYNVGETKADSFNVKVELVNQDNTRQIIFEQNLDSLNANSKHYYQVNFNTASTTGLKSFMINVDSENEIIEMYEDNNFYSIPFFIQPDTTTPTLLLTIDGGDILDGEYISAEPVVHIELYDQSLIPITDPGYVEIYLNDELIPPDTLIVSYQFSATNPKVVVDFLPVLADGEYYLKVLWKDSRGNIVDSSGVEKFFLVSNEAKLLFVYNYPNPFTNETHFTFKLTQIPDEIRIKIFTIAGRLVRELSISSAWLDYDFNKISWDGKDEDGDLLANGVYLYKVIMKAGDKTEDVTQKLAIVR